MAGFCEYGNEPSGSMKYVGSLTGCCHLASQEGLYPVVRYGLLYTAISNSGCVSPYLYVY